MAYFEVANMKWRMSSAIKSDRDYSERCFCLDTSSCDMASKEIAFKACTLPGSRLAAEYSKSCYRSPSKMKRKVPLKVRSEEEGDICSVPLR